MSTFIVECDPATWARAGLDRASEAESRAICERVFAATLDGHPLVSNRSIWRSFPFLWNERWSHRNIVLIGDALRTAHYSIGSGTRLALEDALALDQGAGGGARRSARRARPLRGRAPPDRGEAGGGLAPLRRLVRSLPRAYAARARSSWP